jgi:outer membrane immunogenic protein
MKTVVLAAASAAAIATVASAALAADGVYNPVPQISPSVAPVYAPAYPTPMAFDWSGPYAGALAGFGWSNFTGAITAAPSGFLAGAFVGFNVQANTIVYGAEMDGEWSGRNDGAGNAVPLTSSFRARLGFALNRFLPYGTAGIAIAHVTTSTPSSSMEVGVTGGVGLDAALGNSLFVRGEYLFTHYGTVGSTGSSLTTSEIRTGLGFSF